MDSIIEGLRQHWLNQKLALGQGVSEGQLAQFEAKYQVALPADFRQYLAVLNGLADCDADSYFISFWPLDRIESVLEAYTEWDAAEANCFIFADWSIECQHYAIRLSRDEGAPTPIFVTYNLLQQIASSFTEFIERYLEGDEELLFPKLDGAK